MEGKEKLNTSEGRESLQHSLGFLVNSLARLIRTALEVRLQDTGLSPTTWTVLMALGECDALSQTDLSRRTYHDGATITRALDQLEELNLIERHRDGNDRRVQIVVLTKLGREAYLKAIQYGKEINDRATVDLPAPVRSRFEENIRQVITRSQYILNHEAASGK